MRQDAGKLGEGARRACPHSLSCPSAAVLRLPTQAGLYGITAAAVAFFIFSNVRRWFKEARAQNLAAGGGGYSSDWA